MSTTKSRYPVLLIAFALFVGAWLSRTQLAEFALSSSMQASGMINVVTEIHQLNLDQSKAPHLKFSLATDTGLLQVDIRDTLINYAPGQLIKGRVESIVIDKLSLHYENTDRLQNNLTESRQVLEPLKFIELLRHTLDKHIFYKTLLIKNITLYGANFSTLHNKTLQLNSSSDEEKLYAELTLLSHFSAKPTAGLSQLVVSRLSNESLSAELRLTATPDATPTKLEFNIHDAAISGSYHINPRAVQRWLQPFSIINSVNGSGDISGTLSFNFESNNQINSVLTAQSDNVTYNSNNAENVDIKLKTNYSFDGHYHHIQLQKDSYAKAGKISYDNLSLGDTQLNIAGELTTSADAWQYKGNFNSNQLAINYNSQLFKLKDFAANININPELLTANGNSATVAVPGEAEFKLVHSLNEGTGDFSINLKDPIDLTTSNNQLSQLLTPWPYHYDLMTGSISLSSYASWSQNNDLKLTSIIQINDAGGHIGELIFSGLSFDHELEVLPELHSIRTSKINIAHIDSGITAENISTDITLEASKTGPQPKLVFQALRGEIFGGTFSGDNLVFDLNRNINSFKIKATNIDLAEIVKTQQLEDISATGRIDGMIPVQINEQGIVIEDGAFINDIRSGTIRYNPTTSTDILRQNPLTGIALDALKDFRYSELSANVNFTPEGTLTINLQLKGTSPELDTDRPVHLNIDTEQNLIALLKSLRFAQGVSENIDKKVRHQYEQSK